MDDNFRDEDDVLDNEKETGGKSLRDDDEPESLDELLEKELDDDKGDEEEDGW